MRPDFKWVWKENFMVEAEAACQRVANSDSVHTPRHNQSLRDCHFHALKLWIRLHSSTYMKGMYADTESMIRIPSRKGFSWEEMANEQDKQKKLLAQFAEMLIPKEAKPKEASGAEKPNEVPLQKSIVWFRQDLSFDALATHVLTIQAELLYRRAQSPLCTSHLNFVTRVQQYLQMLMWLLMQ